MIPNILTITRICLTPIIASTFYFPCITSQKIALSLFLIACVTDFLDGFVARRLKLQTALGAFLDPLADKVLVLVTLFFLAGFKKISIYSLIPASIIIIREILLVGLRNFFTKKDTKVHYVAKWKTFFQMLAISFLLIDFNYSIFLGEFLLWISAFLTVYTAVFYIKAFRTKQ